MYIKLDFAIRIWFYFIYENKRIENMEWHWLFNNTSFKTEIWINIEKLFHSFILSKQFNLVRAMAYLESVQGTWGVNWENNLNEKSLSWNSLF